MIRINVAAMLSIGLAMGCTTISDNDPDISFSSTVGDAKQQAALGNNFDKNFEDLLENDQKVNKAIPIYYDQIPVTFNVNTETKFFESMEQRLERVNVVPKNGVNHQLIAKVDITGENGGTVLNGVLLQQPTFADGDLKLPNIGVNFNYDNVWEKVVCWPQIPAYVVSLSLYSAVPTWYPCTGGYKYTKELAIEHMRKAVQAAGGDFGVATMRMFPDEPESSSFGIAAPKPALPEEPKVNFVQLSIYKVDKRLLGKNMKTTPIVFERPKTGFGLPTPAVFGH